ncbi:MAG: hypothetical protein ACYDDO_14975 [Acidiferrobacterales bacterium]
MAALALTATMSPAAFAHAIAGMRVFPATMSFDDPGVADEVPWVFGHVNAAGTDENTFGVAFAKRLTPRFGIVMSTDYQRLVPGDGMPAVDGWDNLTVAGAWQLFVHSDAESIGMLQLSDSIGHSGSRAIGSAYSTYVPEFAYGKGFGGLPHSFRMLRPMAFTTAVSEELPTDSRVPHMLDWNFSLQYNISYLQNFVRYEGIKAPFNRMVPIIEIPLQTCLDRGCANRTTGYVNPGVMWVGRFFQWGIEAQVPVDSRTGHSVGVLLGMDFYLDDIASHSFGMPLFH